MYIFFNWLTSFLKKNQQLAHVHVCICVPLEMSRSVVIVQTTREKNNTHMISKIESFISLQKNRLYHVTNGMNLTTTCFQFRSNLVRYDGPARIHWALWQEAKPSQSNPFPPQPQCEVHSPSGNNIETFKNTDFGPIPSTFFSSPLNQPLQTGLGLQAKRWEKKTKHTLWSRLGEEF